MHEAFDQLVYAIADYLAAAFEVGATWSRARDARALGERAEPYVCMRAADCVGCGGSGRLGDRFARFLPDGFDAHVVPVQMRAAPPAPPRTYVFHVVVLRAGDPLPVMARFEKAEPDARLCATPLLHLEADEGGRVRTEDLLDCLQHAPVRAPCARDAGTDLRSAFRRWWGAHHGDTLARCASETLTECLC